MQRRCFKVENSVCDWPELFVNIKIVAYCGFAKMSLFWPIDRHHNLYPATRFVHAGKISLLADGFRFSRSLYMGWYIFDIVAQLAS